MDRLFSRPIRTQQLLSTDVINLIFPNLEEILEIHEQFNASMKKKRTENPLVGDIGPVLLEMVTQKPAEYYCKISIDYITSSKMHGN